MTAPQLTVQIQGQTPVSADNLNTYAQTCNIAADLRAFVGITGMEVLTRGTDEVNDGGAGTFYWDVNATGPDDNVNVIVPTASAGGAWVRVSFSASANLSPWTIAGGTADVITGTYSPVITALSDGLLLGFRASAANKTATPTFQPDSQTAYVITDNGGQPLVAGAIPGPNAEVLIRYNLANTRWELLNPGAVGGSSASSWVIAGGAADALTATYAPAITALYDGLLLYFRATAANATGTPTFSPNSLTAHPFTKYGGLTLAPGDLVNLGEYAVRYNLANTRWELLNPSTDQPASQVSIASATTTDLGTVRTNNALITGATTITSFGSSASTGRPIYFIEFGGVLTLTNSSALILPGGANITTAANDTAIAEYLGSGNWRVRQYTIAATGGGGGAPSLVGQAKQGLLFSGTGGTYTLISSFGGVTASRTGTGAYNVTLGATALTMGFFLSTATNNGSGDSMGLSDPVVTVSAGNTYGFLYRFTSSKTATDPTLALLLFF